MAGDFGFDPLRLGANSNLLPYYQEAELMNGRYACLACLGAILSEVAFPEFQWWEAGAQDYGFTIQQLLMVQVPLMAIFEAKRIEGWQKTGGVGVLTEFPFDPLNKYEGKESNYVRGAASAAASAARENACARLTRGGCARPRARAGAPEDGAREACRASIACAPADSRRADAIRGARACARSPDLPHPRGRRAAG